MSRRGGASRQELAWGDVAGAGRGRHVAKVEVADLEARRRRAEEGPLVPHRCGQARPAGQLHVSLMPGPLAQLVRPQARIETAPQALCWLVPPLLPCLRVRKRPPQNAHLPRALLKRRLPLRVFYLRLQAACRVREVLRTSVEVLETEQEQRARQGAPPVSWSSSSFQWSWRASSTTCQGGLWEAIASLRLLSGGRLRRGGT